MPPHPQTAFPPCGLCPACDSSSSPWSGNHSASVDSDRVFAFLFILQLVNNVVSHYLLWFQLCLNLMYLKYYVCLLSYNSMLLHATSLFIVIAKVWNSRWSVVYEVKSIFIRMLRCYMLFNSYCLSTVQLSIPEVSWHETSLQIECRSKYEETLAVFYFSMLNRDLQKCKAVPLF